MDIFLVKQLLDKREQEEVPFIPESTKEEDLERNINGLSNLSDELFEAPLIYAVNQPFSEDDVTKIKQYTNQKNAIVGEIYLFGTFDEPIAINVDDMGAYQETLSNFILDSGNYMLWAKDEKTNTLLFFQTMENPIYYNQNALLLIQLNEDGKMIQYVQTKLAKEDDQEEEKDLIKQIDAVSRIYPGILESKDTITEVQLGYHNLTALPTGEQILNPTWNVTVDKNEGGTKHYFVNAIEGHDYPQNDDFIEISIEAFRETIQRARAADIQFIHTEDEKEEKELINLINQNLTKISNAINGVEKE